MNLEEAITICPTPAALVERDSKRADYVADQLKKYDGLSIDVAFSQGDLWVEVQKDAHYATKGFESAEDFFKSLNLEISLREMQYRATIVRVMALLGVARDDYRPAGITKLKYITELLVNGEIIDPVTEIAEPLAPIMVRMVQEAPKKTVKQVRAEVDQLLGKSGEEQSEFTWLNLPIRRDAKEETVDRAIEIAVAKVGGTIDVQTKEIKDISKAAAVELIFADWLADPNNNLEDYGNGGDFEDSFASGDALETQEEVEE